ncbi:MAG: branched-chain amino acid ABC transporter permease [Eubacteriales bacterium]|nr:branched-chain amino acid ABC transporter permease [Eubacteriales bacterium]
MPKKNKRGYIINIIGILIVFALLCLLFDTGILGRRTEYMKGLATIGMFSIIMVCSLNLLTGYMGEFSLGHAGFMSVGAYTAGIFTMLLKSKGITVPDLPLFIVSLILGGFVAGVVGIIVGIPALRLRGDYLCIVTVAVAEIIRVVLCNLSIPAITGSSTFSKSFAGIPKIADYHYVFFAMVTSVTIMYMYIRSRYGRAVIAIREDYIAAASSGLNVTKHKVMTFTISAFFAGIAGAIYALSITSLLPTYFNFSKSSEFLAMVIMGGSGSMTGSIVAAPILSALPQIISYVNADFASYRMLIYAVLLVLVMIFKPSGLFGNYEFSLTRVVDKVLGKGKGGATVNEGGKKDE